MKMRNLLVPIIFGFTVGCSPAGGGSGSAFERVMSAGKPQTTSALQTIRYLEQLTHDAPQMKFGVEAAGIASLAVFDVKRNGVETWLTDNGLSYSLQDGFLRGTRGLLDDLMTAEVSQVREAIKGLQTTQVSYFTTHIGPETQTVKRKFDCQISTRRQEDLIVNGKSLDTTIMVESCEGDGITFENLFWVQAGDRRIVQSRQWVSPKIGSVVMRDGPNR